MPVFKLMSAAVICLCGVPAFADTVALQATADNTLYQDDFGAFSNGSGEHMFAGMTALQHLHRACVLFDVSSIPPGATINSATVTLHLTRSISDFQEVTLHRISASWGEGASVAPGREGGGADSAPGDATWQHRFYPTSFWSTPGGDFNPIVSATQMVDFIDGPFDWTGPVLVSDVQGWVDGAATNHGWMIVGAEEVEASSKRFASRNNIDPGLRPVLTVNFTVPPPPCDGDYDGDLDADFADITFVLAHFNNPYTFGDVTVVLANFGNDCSP